MRQFIYLRYSYYHLTGFADGKVPPHGCKLYFLSKLEVLNWEIENVWIWD